MRTPSEWTYVLYAAWSMLVARGRFAEAAALSDEVRDAMRRSRPFVADVTWIGLITQVATEQGRTDDALDALDHLRSTPYAATSHWWRAWALARGGRLDDVRAHLRAFDGPLADDWYRSPLLCAAIEAAAIVGDAEFAAAHVDVLRPLQDYVAVAGSGGLVLGPIALAVARSDLLLGDDDGARGRWPGPSGSPRRWARRRGWPASTRPAADSDRAPIRLQPARRTISSMEPTADLRFYLQIHAKLRADSARYVAAVERVVETDRTRRSALRRWAEGFVDELLEHHHAEDDHLFPDLAARVPASRPVLARLDADHRLLDDVLERWAGRRPRHQQSGTGRSQRPATSCSPPRSSCATTSPSTSASRTPTSSRSSSATTAPPSTAPSRPGRPPTPASRASRSTSRGSSTPSRATCASRCCPRPRWPCACCGGRPGGVTPSWSPRPSPACPSLLPWRGDEPPDPPVHVPAIPRRV